MIYYYIHNRPGSRPADSPSSWSKWKGELSLAVGLPSNVIGGYTAGRMADIGSLCRELLQNWLVGR